MTKYMLAALAALALIAPSLAQADDTEIPGFPTSAPVHLSMVESLEPVAEAYWALRGVTLPTPVEVFVIPDTPLGAAFGDEPGNRVWLTEELLEGRGSSQRIDLCVAYLHERGHNAGLAHGSGDPVMQASPWEVPGEVVIPKCFKWAEAGYRSSLSRK
jgi:hypothetical protein